MLSVSSPSMAPPTICDLGSRDRGRFRKCQIIIPLIERMALATQRLRSSRHSKDCMIGSHTMKISTRSEPTDYDECSHSMHCTTSSHTMEPVPRSAPEHCDISSHPIGCTIGSDANPMAHSHFACRDNSRYFMGCMMSIRPMERA